jgi:hypothetical protein
MEARHGLWKSGAVVLVAGMLAFAANVSARSGSSSAVAARSPKMVLTSSTDTLPSTTSAASLYLSNWQNMQAI